MEDYHRSVIFEILKAKDLDQNTYRKSHSLLEDKEIPLIRCFQSRVSTFWTLPRLFKVQEPKNLSESQNDNEGVGEDTVLLGLVGVYSDSIYNHGQQEVATVDHQVLCGERVSDCCNYVH